MTDTLGQSLQPTETLSEQDRAALETVKMKRELAVANAKAAIAQSETAELAYKNVVLQLAVKYKLNDGDLIEEDGKVVRK